MTTGLSLAPAEQFRLVALLAVSAQTMLWVLVALLVIVGVITAGTGLWLLRSGGGIGDVLGPLDVMTRKRWRTADPSAQQRQLDEARPVGARPLPLDEHAERSLPRASSRNGSGAPVARKADKSTGGKADSARKKPTPTAAPAGALDTESTTEGRRPRRYLAEDEPTRRRPGARRFESDLDDALVDEPIDDQPNSDDAPDDRDVERNIDAVGDVVRGDLVDGDDADPAVDAADDEDDTSGHRRSTLRLGSKGTGPRRPSRATRDRIDDDATSAGTGADAGSRRRTDPSARADRTPDPAASDDVNFDADVDVDGDVGASGVSGPDRHAGDALDELVSGGDTWLDRAAREGYSSENGTSERRRRTDVSLDLDDDFDDDYDDYDGYDDGYEGMVDDDDDLSDGDFDDDYVVEVDDDLDDSDGYQQPSPVPPVGSRAAYEKRADYSSLSMMEMDDMDDMDFDNDDYQSYADSSGRGVASGDPFFDDDFDGEWEHAAAQGPPRRRARREAEGASSPAQPRRRVPSTGMSSFDPEEMVRRFQERAAAVRRRPLPPVAGEERQEFIQQAKVDFQDFAMIGDAEVVMEDGVLVLRIDLRG